MRNIRRLSGLPRQRRGFTLIEVLVAMTVMVVIIVMVTNMFRDASEAWDMGTQRAEMNTAARAAVEYIARELQSAIAGPIDTVVPSAAAYLPFQLDNEGLKFCVLDETPGGSTRAMRGVLFYHVPEPECRLMYNRISDTSINGYKNILIINQSGSALLITNVWRFEVNIYSNESDMISGAPPPSSYNSSVLPAAVDISIEMLGERDMARALSLPSGLKRDGYVMTNSRVYTARVCFPNRGGSGR